MRSEHSTAQLGIRSFLQIGEFFRIGVQPIPDRLQKTIEKLLSLSLSLSLPSPRSSPVQCDESSSAVAISALPLQRTTSIQRRKSSELYRLEVALT